ncbi:23S rRNA pseudouridine1911/1915/1917 synthase [Anaerosolibacter carboniphilus]|uniref:Pseudouridine synthase n=1 Tax=Anaerosolibacter carboniphilus TaxID=1417629 RepID=A0A841KTQ0_9FIRM|nr:RluA family pseudouridine synthase [Anaerosolibacter carboniphilus]MBB6216966.1 23S rRNA pseudouridine1911/1915/1917 synthase [Anaerosolibacter carboniphilus]
MEIQKFIVDDIDEGQRLDVYIANQLEHLSRSFIQKLIEQGNIQINGSKETVKKYKVLENDEIEVEIPEPELLKVEPEDIPIDIVYEDEDVVIVNKPQGMVVHPAPGNYHGTLVNALLYQCKNLSSINGVIRPGIVHRIDKDTSGLLMVAKNDRAHRSLAEQLKEHSINRVYVALVHGNIKEERGTINAPIGRHPVDRMKMAVVDRNGKNAVTHFRVLERYGEYSLIEAKLETGRTHQIRVHMAYIHHPLVGDPIYSQKKEKFHTEGQALHAQTIGFIHPVKGEYMEFHAEIPERFRKIIKIIENLCRQR